MEQTTSSPLYTDYDAEQAGDQLNPFLGGIRQWAVAQPGYAYGDILPLKRDQQGNVSFGVPNMLRSMVNGGVDLLEAPQTGVFTPEATGALAMMVAPDLLKTAPEEGVLNTFGGIGSMTANKNALIAAKNMVQNRALTPADVWKNTGWYQDPLDSQWKYEIDDQQAGILPKFYDSVSPPMSSAPRKTTLGQIFQHDELYKAYPSLRDMPVVLAPEGTVYRNGVTGGYFPGDGNDPEHLFIASNQGPLEAKDTLLHELQHAIQRREGFTGGTNPAQAYELYNKKLGLDQGDPLAGPIIKAQYWETPYQTYRAAGGEIEANNVETRAAYDPAARKRYPPWKTEDATVVPKWSPEQVKAALAAWYARKNSFYSNGGE